MLLHGRIVRGRLKPDDNVGVRVRFASSLRYLVGGLALDLDLPQDANMSWLFRELQQKVRDVNGAAGHVHDLSRLIAYIAVLRNGEAIVQEQFDSTVLTPGDVIDLVPPIAGGV